MKGKKEYIILAAIILGVVAYLLWRPTDRTTYELPRLPAIAKDKINKIEITTGDKTIHLARKDNAWQVGPQAFPADKEKIDRLLDTVSTLTLTALVSETQSSQRYDLSPEKRVHVKAWAGDDLFREFDVGKAADTFRHTFVKIADDDRIFHAQNNFRERFDTTIADLRDKQVMAFKTDDIESFKIVRGKKTTTFKKIKNEPQNSETGDSKTGDSETKDATGEKATEPEKSAPQWVADDGQTADVTKIGAYLTALADLECKQFLEKPDDIPENPAITIELAGTKSYSVVVYTPDAKEEDAPLWPATSSESPYPFLLADWKAKEIVKEPGDLLPDKAESDDKAEQKQP